MSNRPHVEHETRQAGTPQEIRKLMTTQIKSSNTLHATERHLAALLANKRELTDDELAGFIERIRPVFQNDEGRYFYFEPVDPRTAAFTWSPVSAVEATGIVYIVSIFILHNFGNYGFFRPSIAEVISMIPRQLLQKVVAFETTSPDNAVELNRHSLANEAGYHLGVTHLYA